MYLVVSQWEAIPGHEEDFDRIGLTMRGVLAAQPGVELIKTFQAESGKVVVVHGYTDEAAYNKVVSDPSSPFLKAMQETELESHARWISSDRGMTRD